MVFGKLSENLCILILLLSGQRSQSIASLGSEVVFGSDESCIFHIIKMLKISRPGHVQNEFCLKGYPAERRLCVKTLTREYVKRTGGFRTGLAAGEDTLFLSFKTPNKSVGASTISRWTLEVMRKAGVDTDTFKSHSTRAAATSVGRTMLPIDKVLASGGWSSATTFAKFYDKKVQVEQSLGEAILQRFTQE